MAEVDTSSYPRPQAPQNPLDQILKVGQVADTLGGIEVGKGMQAAIQPDGSVDRNALAQILKQTVAGSMAAPKALTAVEHLRNAGHQADAAGLQNFSTRMSLIASATAHIIDDPSKEGVMRGLSFLANPNNGASKVGLGIPQLVDAQKQFYDAKGNLKPPGELVKIAKQLNTQALQSQEALRMHLPGSENVDTGQGLERVSTGSAMAPAVGRFTQKEIGPDATQPGADNQPTYRGTQPRTPTSYAPGTPGAPTSGGQPVKLAQPGDGTAYGVPRGGPAAAAPGAAEAQREVGAISGKNLAADLDASKNYQRTVYPLEKAIPALEKLGTTGTGPGTSEINNVKSFLLSMGVPGVNVEKIKNYDEANKYLVDFVNQTGNSGTNDKLAAAFSGNPSTKISNAAAQDVAKAALALQKMQRAQLSMFQKSGLPDDQYSKFTSSNALKLDPRAFGIDYMKPEQVKKMLESMKGDKNDIKSERGKFFYSLREAHDAGLLKERQ